MEEGSNRWCVSKNNGGGVPSKGALPAQVGVACEQRAVSPGPPLCPELKGELLGSQGWADYLQGAPLPSTRWARGRRPSGMSRPPREARTHLMTAAEMWELWQKPLLPSSHANHGRSDAVPTTPSLLPSCRLACSHFFFLNFYFILEYSGLTML